MFTASLPPFLPGDEKAHLSLTPAAHRLPRAGVDTPPDSRAAPLPDYERTCTPENGCDLPDAGPRHMQTEKKGATP